jgi:hypothetical protein
MTISRLRFKRPTLEIESRSGNSLVILLKTFLVVARRQFLVYDQNFGITYLSHLQGLR